MVLMDDKPAAIPVAIRIARRTLRIVRQNITFALAVKLIVPGAVGAEPARTLRNVDRVVCRCGRMRYRHSQCNACHARVICGTKRLGSVTGTQPFYRADHMRRRAARKIVKFIFPYGIIPESVL